MAITARQIDPRDQSWEVDDPPYRVYFWGPDGSSDEWELIGADVDEVLRWAQGSANDRPFTLYCVVKQPGEVGLLRLSGADPNVP